MATPNSMHQEEHEFTTNSKKVFLVGSNATINAVVNTTAATDPKIFVGLVTAVIGSAPTLFAVVNTSAGGGTTTVTPVGLTTLAPSPNFIGIVTVANPSSFTGNVTLDPGSRTGILGNVTLSDAKTTIGLVTLSGGTAWTDPKAFIGLATVNNGTAWPDPKAYVGLASVNIGGGNVGITGNVTLTDSKGFIGIVTVGGMADPKNFVGLVTVVPTYISGYTSLTTILSATGLVTLVVAPAGQKTFLRNLHVSSLGRAEMSVWGSNTAASTSRIPWTSLSTTSGFFEHYGADGLQMGSTDWGLNVVLNGGATIGIMADVRFA